MWPKPFHSTAELRRWCSVVPHLRSVPGITALEPRRRRARSGPPLWSDQRLHQSFHAACHRCKAPLFTGFMHRNEIPLQILSTPAVSGLGEKLYEHMSALETAYTIASFSLQ